MVNINTLNELNRLGIGADISKLESYIIDYKQANLTTNMYVYEHDYLRMNKILKELKADSLAFTDKTTLEDVPTDSYDKLLMKYNNRVIDEIYGSTDTRMDELCDYIKSQEDGCIDMVAIPNVLGISVRCSYTNGYLYRVNIIGDNYKYTDITARFREQLPKFVEDFSKHSLVELRGKVTIFNNHADLQNSYLNVECSTMHLLRLGLNSSDMSIVIDDLFIDTDDLLPFDNQWDKLEYIRELGFNVPHHALIRNVEHSILEDAFSSFRDYFSNIEETSGIIYKYNGYQIRNNKELSYEQDYSKFSYIYDKCDYKNLYSSRIKSILTVTGKEVDIMLKVIPVKCNDDFTVDTVLVTDINILDTYDLSPGNTVFFFINNGIATIAKNRQR